MTVDVPKQGFGTTNDGNTARRAFANAEVFADFVEVDINLINRSKNILIIVNSGYEINIDPFRQYCLRTSDLLVEKYGWYVMPPTIHKLLEHGPEIAEHLE